MIPHWSHHAVEQFLARYDAGRFSTEEFFGIVPRIERALEERLGGRRFRYIGYTNMFVNIQILTEDRKDIVRVKLIYDALTKTVITALPVDCMNNRRYEGPRIRIRRFEKKIEDTPAREGNCV